MGTEGEGQAQLKAALVTSHTFADWQWRKARVQYCMSTSAVQRSTTLTTVLHWSSGSRMEVEVEVAAAAVVYSPIAKKQHQTAQSCVLVNPSEQV